jgi:hypothetical protein
VKDHHGNRLYHKVQTWYAALTLLQDKQIEWAIARRQKIRDKSSWNSLHRSTDGIHIYFFNQCDREVAYWTPIMNSLFINHKPRVWHEAYLCKSTVYAYNEGVYEIQGAIGTQKNYPGEGGTDPA